MAKAATQTTVTLKHLAATLAGNHEMAKKQSEAILNDLVTMMVKHLKKGRSHPHRRLWNSSGPQARRSHGPQSGDGRTDQDQSEQKGRFPRGQGTQGSCLI